MKEEFFRISSGLKSLIGSELITDNFVAVFELVKNSFDAKAKNVEIIFEDIYTPDAKIIIKDDGKGMDYDDLFNKWLFVAYSAKKDGTEDEVEEPKDYRVEIENQQVYAGAKGVGRFSCDRLGRYLNLITIKDENGSKIENLKVDWKEFEVDQKKEFIKIPVQHQVLKSVDYNIKHGTILEITGIDQSEWNRDSFLKLKERLSKLIRPDLHKDLEYRDFKIQLIVEEEKEKDDEIVEKARKDEKDEGFIYSKIVNGEIKNFIFDELDIRTTKITTHISPDGDFLETRLDDRGLFIYEIKEKNPFPLLHNISITLYFLNRSAKIIFKRKMGVETVRYGNIFVYKNGFRIYPFGERGDDSLGIDNRAVQGYARYVGLRNLIGQISIQGDNEELREATSRDAGLIKTKTFNQLTNLEDSLLITALRRLEKYVVDVTKWGINDENFEVQDSEETKEELVKLISNIFNDQSLVSIKYNKDIIDIIDNKEEKSAKKLLSNFKRVAAESNDKDLIKDAQRLEDRIIQQSKALESASKELQDKDRKTKDLESELEGQVGETMFARAVVGIETKELLSIQHHIYRHAAQHVTLYIDRLMEAINENQPKEKLQEIASKIAFENKKIITLSRFVTKANFDTTTTRIKKDLIAFVNEYALNVYKEYKHIALNNQKIDIRVKTPKDLSFVTHFKPIELIIILDNLLNNAFKANATEVILTWAKTINTQEVSLSISDNGIGISQKNIDKVFEFRYSTTDGSGLGLFHAKDTIEKMGGSIEVKNNEGYQGVTFILKFKK